MAITLVGSALGLLRDLSIAAFFGATGATDAFVVAWTIPETATPLLMEGAMAAMLVPLFSHDLERRGSFKESLGGMLLPVVGFLTLLTGLTALAAPLFVDLLAPGLAERAIGIRSVRVASLTILWLGLSGYLMAALRARQSFGWPAAVYIAYNIGILSTIVLFHDSLGILSASIGLSVGAFFMVLVQLPAFTRLVGLPRPTLRPTRELIHRLGAFLPLVTYSLGRHSQVFIERFAGSLLTTGTISQLNYATKVGQLPMLLAITASLVTLPALSRSAAGRREDRFRSIVDRNLRLVAFCIVPVVGFFIVFAPNLIALLFERGAFNAADTSATAAILRVYALGLVGQVWVVVCVEALVARPGRTWHPAKAALWGLLLTATCAAAATPLFGAPGIALANVAGITLMAVLLLRSLPAAGTGIDLAGLLNLLLVCISVTAAAVALTAGAKAVLPEVSVTAQVAVVTIGGLCFGAVYGLGTWLLGVPETTHLVRLANGYRRDPSVSDPWILMYHAVEPHDEDPYSVCVSPERFRSQMKWLARRGLRAVSMRELTDRMQADTALGLVGLTFDDAYAGFREHVAPVLNEHAFSATVFAVAGRLGGVNDWDDGPRRRLMTAEALTQLAAEGFEVGSHGLTHARLTTIAGEDLEREMVHSRALLQETVAAEVTGFCYPYGAYNNAAVDAARAAGYHYACAYSPKERGERFILPRTFVGERDGSARLGVKLALHRLGVRLPPRTR